MNADTKTAGIICECNPFHSGHAHLIREARRQSGADFVIAVMSGDFVQRGEPAVFDKYTRTRQALEGGADIVFELPVRFSLSSAGDFALGGVLALQTLGVVTDLFFGSECGDLAPLMEAADILYKETADYRELLQDALRSGLSFPAARALALSRVCTLDHSILEQPNNILGIEYCRAILTLKAPIAPHTIPRVGQGYNESGFPDAAHPSATALRRQIYLSETPHLCLNDCSEIIGYTLLKHKTENMPLDKYKDVSPELAARIYNQLDSYYNITEFIRTCQTRTVTESRIRRALLQAVLELSDTDISMPYLRLLGIKKEAGRFLKSMPDHRVKILRKLASDVKTLNEKEASLLEKDLLASGWYRQMWRRKYAEPTPNEYQRPVIVC